MNAPDNFKRNAAQRHKDRLIEAQYREWIDPFALCVKCLRRANDLAHIRGHAQGFMKPPPWHTVPLCRTCHEDQEVNREWFSPLTVSEAQKQGEKLFNAWEISGDADLWLACLLEFNGKIAR